MLRLCDGLVDLDRIQRLRVAIEEGRKEMREVLLFILRAYNKQQTKKKKKELLWPHQERTNTSETVGNAIRVGSICSINYQCNTGLL